LCLVARSRSVQPEYSNALPLLSLNLSWSAKVMEEMIDLTGDGGVLKTVVRKAKDDAIAPSESLPLVDGMALLYISCVSSKHCTSNIFLLLLFYWTTANN
jgi:hypothetical protein